MRVRALRRYSEMSSLSSHRARRLAVTLVVVAVCAGFGGGSTAPTGAFQRDPTAELDRVLDLYVRDGLVYYSALRAERAVIDRFLASIESAPPRISGSDLDRQKALWVNAYNVIVLKTVLDHYPIRGSAPEYPPNSIRQVPGAFESRPHRIAGRQVTLDMIETRILPEFGDPRVFLALGRGAVDGGRLRSEVYRGDRLDAQLSDIVREFSTTPRYVDLDQFGRELRVSAIFGWREAEFVEALSEREWMDVGRSALESAILQLIEPELFPTERDFLRENDFVLSYHAFDWRLNDLTGGRPSNR